MPSLITRGGMSAKALGFGASTSGPAVYVEDVFSTYLYTGNGASQTVVNNISIGDYYAGVSGGAIQTASGSYCTVPNNTAFDFGSGSFTIEFFVYYDGSAQWDAVYKGTASIYAPFGVVLGSLSGYGGYVSLFCSTSGAGWEVGISSQFNLILNAWNHVAVVRNGNVFNVYVNGVGGLSPATVSGALVVNSQAVGLGGCNNGDYSQSGRLSNLRIVKGTAVYTANFSPPTSALTAISGTQLLCFQGSTPFVDNSANAFTITQVGSPSALTTGPFPYTTGNGGLVWLKSRSETSNHELFDTARGVNLALQSNFTGGNSDLGPSGPYSPYGAVGSFNSNGFSINGPGYTSNYVNTSSATYASWTFRKQSKFFDVVTYTGDGASQRQISHNLGVTPGFMIVKSTSLTSDWQVAAATSTGYAEFVTTGGTTGGLNLTNAAAYTGSGTGPLGTATYFQPTWNTNSVAANNQNGATYVAYLFASSNSGGFGAAGTDSVVACGSFTTDGSGNATVSLGWEPQLGIVKSSSAAGNWVIQDIMRGAPVGGGGVGLYPNSASAEASFGAGLGRMLPNATGFTSAGLDASTTYIYLAIRRGPMKTPTDATKVYTTQTWGGGGTAPPSFISGFPVDFGLYKNTTSGTGNWGAGTRLQGSVVLFTNLTSAESSDASQTYDYQNGYYSQSGTVATLRSWMFRRAPGFFDVVCYTGTGSATTVAHNLGVAPELMIVKSRSSVGDVSTNWAVYHSALGANYICFLNGTSAQYGGYSPWFNSSPVSSTSFGANTSNNSGTTYVAYLFATCPGVSKVGSYIGTGAAQNIDCGFSASARFILIKRTDSAGDWYVYDSARGISSGNDPYLLINSAAAEVTGTDYVNTYASGFALTSSAPAGLNANGGTYIFLAIA